MFRTSLTRRLAAAGLTAAVVVVASPALMGEATAAPYPARSATSTQLGITHGVVARGAANSASVSVSSDAGTPSGTVTLRVAGVASYTMRLSNGTASHALPTDLRPGTYRVTVRYSGAVGTPGGPTTGYKPSSDTAFYTVKGSGAVAGEDESRGRNRAGTGGAVDDDSTTGGTAGSTAAGLGATGAGVDTGLLAMLGLGMLGAGVATIFTYRRRSGS